MILSRKFVSDYIDLDNDLTIEQIASDMTNVGNEYDNASKLIECTNLVVGEVVECVDHPDSDHLHVCKVDIGSDVLSIVCGAPNVRSGLKVIVALVGAKLPGGVIKQGVIRGVESNGMLCSLLELGLDSKFLDESEIKGICELPLDSKVGTNPIEVLNLDDEIIDFELTSNRGDLLSMMGMAYELGAIYNKKIKEVDTSYDEKNIDNDFTLEVLTEDCPLFIAKRVSNVEIKESPAFIKARLIACGIRPINNVVDISNYVMLETGQPLHFYDANRLGNKLIVRDALDGETLTTLDGNERILSKSDIVIADSNNAIGLAGVMGGLSTEIEYDTTNVVIEAAIFDSIRVRKTANKILRSEASNRFEKGLDPNRVKLAIDRCCNLLEKYASATIYSDYTIHNTIEVKDNIISINVKDIVDVLGIDISKDKIIDIFKALDFKVEEDANDLKVTVPSRRKDISIKEDLIEEVGRIYGIDNIIGKLPTIDASLGVINKTKREIKNKLVSLGLNETISYSLINGNRVKDFVNEEIKEVKLNDPMSEDRNTLRYSLLSSLYDIYLYNKNRNIYDISIFEIGKGFYQDAGIYKENDKLAILMSGNYYTGLASEKADFYIIKGIIEELFDYLGYSGRYSIVEASKSLSMLHPGQSGVIVIDGAEVGCIGKISPEFTQDDIFVSEIDLSKVMACHPSKMLYKEIAKYPAIIKDLAFIVDKDVKASTISNIIKKSGGKLLVDVNIFDVYTGSNLDGKKSIAYKLTFQDKNKTLTDEEVMQVFNNIISTVLDKIDAKLRDQ